MRLPSPNLIQPCTMNGQQCSVAICQSCNLNDDRELASHTHEGSLLFSRWCRCMCGLLINVPLFIRHLPLQIQSHIIPMVTALSHRWQLERKTLSSLHMRLKDSGLVSCWCRRSRWLPMEASFPSPCLSLLMPRSVKPNFYCTLMGSTGANTFSQSY